MAHEKKKKKVETQVYDRLKKEKNLPSTKTVAAGNVKRRPIQHRKH